MSRALSILVVLAVLIAGAGLLRSAPVPLAPPPDDAGIPAEGGQADHLDPDMISHVPLSPAFADVMPAGDYRRAVVSRAAWAHGGHALPHDGEARAGDGRAGTNDAQGRATAGPVRDLLASSPFAPDWLDQIGPGELVHLPVALARTGEFAPVVPGKPEPQDPAPGEPSYWRDAMPIIRAECTSCHYTGGIGPFPLETYADAAQSAYLIRRSMEERFMPPLPADPKTSWPIDDPRVMTDADRATLIAWVAAGAPEGDPADAPAVPPPSDPYGPPTLSLDIGVDYTPPEGVMDDYRCFVIDPGFTEDTELVMTDVEQTNRQMFHHGILYLAAGRMAADARRLDAADPEPGYPCFGGPGFASDEWVAGEAVGALPRPYPAGTAKVIPAGSLFALQLHYNTNNGRGPDRSKVHFWKAAAPVNKPPHDARMANFLFNIPPGNANYSVKASIDVVSAADVGRPGLRARVVEGLLWRSWGHMHVLGSSYTLDLIRADGSRVRVLDIPRWDFNWQGTYDHIDPLEVKAGDRLEMTCTWDNSASNQPYIDGKQIEPRAVRWGESTFDEMCLGGVTVTDK